jgi:antitoxin component YwqK of YwqJK toxin-antitoxin module
MVRPLKYFTQLERRDGLGYFEGKPFTGVAVAKYENGNKKVEATFKDGKLSGLYTQWYDNGKKEFEATFHAGEVILSKSWYKRGDHRRSKKTQASTAAGLDPWT